MQAPDTPTPASWRGEAADPKPANGDDDVTASPEVLVSRAEFYATQALAAGSRLPLARLIKAETLVLEGKFQVGCRVFDFCASASGLLASPRCTRSRMFILYLQILLQPSHTASLCE